MEWIVSLADAAFAIGQAAALGFLAFGGWLSLGCAKDSAVDREPRSPPGAARWIFD